jgi:amino acid transporter
VAALPALASSPAPLVEAAGVYGGPGLARIVRAGTSVSALGIAVGMVATTPRYLSALARGGALGFGLERVAPNGVPLRALFTTWVLVLALVQAGTRGQLFALSSVAVLMQYVVTGLALAALARRGERGLRPSQAWIAVPAVIVATFLTAGAQEREWAVAGVAILLGVGLRAAARRFARARKGPRSGGAARTRLPAGGPPGPEPR